MKIYFKEEMFPEALKHCRRNNRNILCHDIEYIPSDVNKVVVGSSEEEQMDFETFWGSVEEYVYYITVSLMEQTDPNYLAFLEDYGNGDITEQIFLKYFKVEGFDMRGM